MRRARWLAVSLLVLAVAPPAVAQRGGPVLHEPIPPDPGEDVALAVALDGDLPAAINTPHGLVAAPDPAKPIGTDDAPYAPIPKSDAPGSKFHPDRDTQRPDALPYDDPFSPSTAPFKRLAAYDTVEADYTLGVRDPHTISLAVSPTPPPDGHEEQFYADMVVDLAAGRRVRIPSVGPGTRVLRARAGIGTQDIHFTLYRDGAENWYIEGDVTARARLVMELSIPRAAFGGDLGNPTRAELPPVPPLPENVRAAAAQVAAKIGVTPRTTPRETITKLVTYFRAFQDSDEPPVGKGDIYLDLALQQKGVCRHRAFAFLVTALYLGIPTRMISNEAHAWVEVDDGHLWRRIDLGGAGRTLHDPLSANVPYEPPADPFAWPQGSTRGEDLADHARRDASPTNGGTAAPGDKGSSSKSGGSNGANGTGGGNGAGSGNGTGGNGSPGPTTSRVVDERPGATMTMALGGSDARRGAPMPLRGDVIADGEPCGHVTVEILLGSRDASDLPIGVLATDEHGHYEGALVLPTTVPLGDYDVHARTMGDSRCGRGQTK